jgi:Cys-tRNA(Pro)/Cys-tRNA(Cys) deacylase
MIGAMDVHRELLSREIPHEIFRLPRVVLNADELPDLLRVPANQCLGTRLYFVDERPIAVAVAAQRTPQPGAVLAALDGTTLRPATSQQTNELTRYAAGLVNAAHLPVGIPLYVDAEVDVSGTLYLPTGDTGTALGIPSRTFFRLTRARVAHLVEAEVIELPADLSRVRL